MPNFVGLSLAEANRVAAEYGLNISISGAGLTSSNAVSYAQSIEEGGTRSARNGDQGGIRPAGSGGIKQQKEKREALRCGPLNEKESDRRGEKQGRRAAAEPRLALVVSEPDAPAVSCLLEQILRRCGNTVRSLASLTTGGTERKRNSGCVRARPVGASMCWPAAAIQSVF